MAKPLSLNEIRTRAAQFVVEWRDSPGDERQDAQSFVRDLLAVYGITETRAALYEKRAQRAGTGRQGYIDALVPGQLIVEMKSVGKNLALAEIQALDYMDDLTDAEQARYVLSSDFKKFRLLDITATKGEDVTEWSLEELPRYAESLAFLAGYQTRSFGSREQEMASVKAARLMAGLYEALEGSGYSDHDASIFLVRTLFALYADDSGVWERDLFLEFLESRTNQDGSDLGSQLTLLFQVMAQKVERRPNTLDELAARFPYVNGRVFEEPLSIPSFNRVMRDKLLAASAFDWREISPAVFGSLFQAVKSPQARRELGEHYTTETAIMKTIGPLFLDELRDRFDATHHDTNALKKLRSDLSQLRIMDPACGSGNFLIVAYRELRQLELDILLRLQELGDRTAVPALFFEREDLAVQLQHFAGIEIEEWPARIAQTALRLADHQANMAMELALGRAPATLPLDTIEIIHTGNALRMNWAEVLPPTNGVRIVGNPPFIGHISKTKEQSADLKHVWGNLYNGYLDYVTGWYKKAAAYLETPEDGRFAYVSTNSITQGLPVAALFDPLFEAGWRIRFAHQTFAWQSEAPGAANVHCVIIGFDKKAAQQATLHVYPSTKGEPTVVTVDQINGYLAPAPLVHVLSRQKVLSPMLPRFSFGTMPIDGGYLIVEKEEYERVASDPVASKYLRKFVGARELIRGLDRWCLWLEDLDPSDLAKSSLLRERIAGVRAMREGSIPSGDAYKFRNTPHLFRPNRSRPLVPYVCLPSVVSESRNYFTGAHFAAEVIASNLVFTAEDPHGLAFAVASSSMFITWQKAVGGRMKSDIRFSNTLVWNTLPLPNIDDALRQQIIEAGQGVLTARELYPSRSLADHYNPLAMDPTLLKAHMTLDRVVDKAFGTTNTLRSNEERLPILFERYAEMTAAE